MGSNDSDSKLSPDILSIVTTMAELKVSLMYIEKKIDNNRISLEKQLDDNNRILEKKIDDTTKSLSDEIKPLKSNVDDLKIDRGKMSGGGQVILKVLSAIGVILALAVSFVALFKK